MSLAIKTDYVISVLLPDGKWYTVKPKTFDTDAYEFLHDQETIFAGGQNKETIPSTGATWIHPVKGRMCCPLTSVLAVRMAKASDKDE